MQPSKNCLDIIKHYEGFYKNPYLCPAGVPTIGYGTTMYDDGKKVSLRDPAISEADATEQLQHEVNKIALTVNNAVKSKIEQHQFDALVSFAYNLGTGALKGSTLLKLINQEITSNANWKKTITAEFQKWCRAKVKGKSVVLKGLLSRRTTEALLFTNNTVNFFN
jgi:lysozyme